MDPSKPKHKLPIIHRYSESLTFKVTSTIIIIMLVALAVFSFVFETSDRQKLANDITTNGDTFATFTAQPIYNDYSNFYTHIDPGNFQIFKGLVKAMMVEDTNITKIQLVSVSGRILFDSDEFTQGQYTGSAYRTINNVATLNEISSNSPLSSRSISGPKGQPETEIVVPITEIGGSYHVFSVRYVLSYNSLNALINDVYRRIAIVTVILLVFVITVSFLYASRLVLPIRRLTEVANRLRGADLEAKADTSSKDEIGQLGLTLNEMANRMKIYIADIEVSRQKLEEQYHSLRQEHIRLEASIESLNVGFIMTDANNEVNIINRTAKDILSHEQTTEGSNTKIDIDKQTWTTDYVQTRLTKSFDLRAGIEKVLSTTQPVLKDELNYNGRILRLFMAPVMEIESGHMIAKLGSVILLEDITEAKILERSKDEFFSIASHELRTPLTSIRGNSSMMLDYYKEVFKDQQLQEMMQDIHTSAIRLIDIVNDFLDVSRLEQGKVSFSYAAVSVEKVIESTAYEMKAVINEKKIYLKVDKLTLNTLPQVWVDENRLKQVVYNLIGNAAKFTEKGGITVSAHLEPDKDKVKVTVTDTGRGISQDSQQLLFHKFQQTGSSLLTRDTTRGTGLGLYISKMIVETMGGVVKLDRSDAGKGSTFSFTLPVATPERLAAAKKDGTLTNTTTGMTSEKPDLPVAKS
jgi:two-component system phosphate regulon sensor histidine kinase PhoR